MRRREKPTAGGMPGVLARGPSGVSADAVSAWKTACTAWSREQGLGAAGWVGLLPAPVRARWMPSARQRLRVVDDWRHR